MKARGALAGVALATVVEAILVINVIPILRPSGGIFRMLSLFLFFNACALLCYLIGIYPRFVSPLRNVPGPSGGHLFTGQFVPIRLSSPPGAQLSKWMETIPNDGLLRARYVLGADAIIPTNEAMIKSIIHDNAYDYEKQPRVTSMFRQILGGGLLLSEGDDHKAQRKQMASSFQTQVARDLHPLIWAKALELITMLKEEVPKAEFDFSTWCTRVTLDIMGTAGFGKDFESLKKNRHDLIIQDYQALVKPSSNVFVFFMLGVVFDPEIGAHIPGLSAAKEMVRISAHLLGWAQDMSAQRRAELANTRTAELERNKRRDILSLLIRNSNMTDRDIANQALTMMAAGHEATSLTVAWCIYLLGENPIIQEQLRAEIRAHLPSPRGPAGERLTAAMIDPLALLNGVTNETLRLYPTIPVTTRKAVRDTRVGPHEVPAGTTVFISPWAINRSTSIWGEDAEEFIPQRWIDKNGRPSKTAGLKNNYSIMTFLHGPRACIGQE
jgi:cytochrome P450